MKVIENIIEKFVAIIKPNKGVEMPGEPEPCTDFAVPFETVVKNEDFIETSNTNICPFCLSEDIYQGGSWTPEKCLYCGAVYFLGGWCKDG